jgi:hypothetical protein
MRHNVMYVTIVRDPFVCCDLLASCRTLQFTLKHSAATP